MPEPAVAKAVVADAPAAAGARRRRPAAAGLVPPSMPDPIPQQH